ncbi:tetratricopeptide repeat protein [Streptomyces sp. NPDC059786]|uniref:tetratricopeptide repeat protein n=1 Tax=Streptomyces sp. NPDC059786 TaxID=3346946 RepID=UPI00364BA4D2
MSGAAPRRRSRGQLIRQRSRAPFVGRRAQLSLFAENLLKDPDGPEDPAEFLFHVHGLGGVGKSTLLRQWQEAARRADAVTAVVDENDVHGVERTLGELARQLAEQAGPLKEFDRAVEQYRREREAAADPVHAEGAGAADDGPSVSSRVVAQAALGAASLLPGAGVVTAMTNPDAAAQGLDRLRAGARARSRRQRAGDEAGVSRAFVAELGRLCDRHRWVVLFFDTWELTCRYLDGWLRDLLEDSFGPLPVNVMVVLAGRDELAERDWAALRSQVADVPLEVFTEAETRALLAARGVTEPGVVEAVRQLSMGLPLLVELLAFARPGSAEDVDAGVDAVDRTVKRFLQWMADPWQRKAVVACALAPQLNEDVFTAAAPQEARGLWSWLCEQPFVSGRGGFKQYHAVVRASMVRQQRTHSPQRWTAAHLRLAETHAGWRRTVEQGLAEAKRWGDPTWRRHRLDETYHRLCAQPAAALPAALEQAVHAAGRDVATVRQFIDTFALAARDSADPALAAWADRLQSAVAGDEPVVACLGALLTHGRPAGPVRAWAHAYRGRHLYLADRDDEAMADLDRAVALDPGNARAWAYRGDMHRFLGHHDRAVDDLTTAVGLDPGDAWALARRGEALVEAGRDDEAIADLTAALAIEPDDARALAVRGEAHRLADRYAQAVDDFTSALGLEPDDAWTLSSRGQAHRQALRLDEAITDFTTALAIDPGLDWVLAERGIAHRQAGRYDEAVTDLTAAVDLDPAYAWALAQRGETHRQAGRYDEAVTDFTTALAIDPALTWALASRGEAHRQAGRLDTAVADLTAALDADPTYAWAMYRRGEAHRMAGRYDEAVTDLTAALAVEPDDPWILGARGQAHRAADRYEEAVADLTAALGIDPALDWVLAHRGATHRLAGRHDEAVTDLTAALALDPEYAWALSERGETHRLAGRYDEAVTDFTAALAIDPGMAWTLASRGEAHQHAGRHDEAVTDLTAALAIDPALTWVLVARGRTHRQAGRLDDALADLDAALDRDPDHTWVYRQRGRVHYDAGRFDAAVADYTTALGHRPDDAWTLAARGQAHRGAGRLDAAVGDLTAALAVDPAMDWALIHRGEAHRQAGRFEAAVADFTAALELDPGDTWALAQRGVARRELRQYAAARADLTAAVAAEPDDLGFRFELTLLSTVTSGFEACADRWAELLASPVDGTDDDATRFFALLRVLLLEPENDVPAATERFLAAGPDPDAVTDLLHYLAELAALTGELADRAGACRRLVSERAVK